MQVVESLFSGLSDSEQKIVLDMCVMRRVRKKEEIVSEGSAGRDLFIVVSGHLRVSTISSEGKEISFGVLGEKEYFGELSMLDGRRRSATVTISLPEVTSPTMSTFNPFESVPTNFAAKVIALFIPLGKIVPLAFSETVPPFVTLVKTTAASYVPAPLFVPR